MEKRTRRNAPLRQAAQETLVSAALETIQGMSVVKAFNLNRDKNKRMEQAIDNSCQKMPEWKKLCLLISGFSKLSLICSALQSCFYLFLLSSRHNAVALCLMMIVASFMIFGELKSAGSGMATLRLQRFLLTGQMSWMKCRLWMKEN